MDDVLTQLLLGIIVFEVVLLLIALGNLKALKNLTDYPIPERWPLVSILVPVRNEAHNIEACVRSLLAQDYPHFELMVLDDSSTDDTWAILDRLSQEYVRLKLIKGKPLPAGWLGKHWACHQLSQVAKGELLLFTDADTRYSPSTLRDSVSAMQVEGADLVSAIPKQHVVSWSERLVVPIIPWSIFNLLPLRLAFRLRLPLLSATIGQFMLFRRETFEHIGGFESVKENIVDDFALGRRVISFGKTWRLLDGRQRVHCRMYRDFQEVFQGLGKNLFAVFNNRPIPFIFVWLWLLIVFWMPITILIIESWTGLMNPILIGLSSAAVVLALLMWGITYWRFGFPGYLIPLYPLSVLMVAIVAFASMILTATGKAKWKGRDLPSRKVV